MAKNESKIQKCICPVCPSYNKCSDGIQLRFCLEGKSICIKNERGCLCMPCPVQKQNNFDKVYYCIRGNYKDQKKAK
jgi:hypothetical protein